jgi:hypothetical protein
MGYMVTTDLSFTTKKAAGVESGGGGTRVLAGSQFSPTVPAVLFRLGGVLLAVSSQ